MLTNQNFSSLYANLRMGNENRGHIQVFEKDLQKSRDILSYSEEKTSKKVCPKCGSDKIKVKFLRGKLWTYLLVLLGMLFALYPLDNNRLEYYCKDCGNKLE